MKRMSDYEGYGFFGIFLAFLGGAIAGAATGLLLAPKTGEETRQQLKDLASTAGDKIADGGRSAYGAVKERLSTSPITRH